MKKVLTVLLAIAVMFTFSFGSAFAAISAGDYNASVSEGYFTDNWAELVKSTNTADETVELEGGYMIDKTVLASAALKAQAQEVYNYYMDNDANVADYLTTVEQLQALLLGTGSATVDVTEAAKKVDAFRLAVAAAQFAADKADALADLGTVITTKYSKEEMKDADAQAAQAATNGDITFVDKDYTYAQAAEKLVEYFEDEVEDIDDFDADVTIADYKDASAAIDELVYGVIDYSQDPIVYTKTPALYPLANVAKGIVKTTGSYDLAVAYDAYATGEDENSEKVAYVDAKNTTNKWYSDSVAADDKSEAANIAAAKAQNAAAYAQYIIGKDSDAVKEADKWLKVADIIVEDDSTATVGDISDAAVRKVYAAKADAIEKLETAAAKYAAEKNADGDLVRDAKDVQDLLEDGIVAIATAADEDAAEAARATYDGKIKAAISATTAEKLQFLKDSIKKAAELAIAEAEENDTYYKAELDEAKEIIDKYLAKIEAAEKDTDVQKLYEEACKKIAKVKTAAELESAWLGAMTGDANATGAGKLYNSAKDYVDYYNKTVEGDEELDDSVLKAKVVDLIAESGVRTNKEIEKLDATAAAKALVSKADVKAAKKAAKAAIDALPAKVKVADLALVQAAYDAIDAYGDLTATPDYTMSDIAAALASLVKDYNAEYAQKYTAVSTTDEAALLALVDEIEAVIDTLEGLDATETQLGYLNSLKESLEDEYLYGTDNNSIQAKALEAVKDAIDAIPINVTEADKATVIKARELYDAYVAKYTDYEALKDTTGLKRVDGVVEYKAPDWYKGYIDIDIDDLTKAETVLGLNADPEWAAVEALKITAKSTAKKGSITVKWTVKGDATGIDGYEIWKSTKQSKGYKKAWTTTKQTYKNSKGLKKGTRYYYKVRAYKMVDGVKYTSDWSNKAYRKAK